MIRTLLLLLLVTLVPGLAGAETVGRVDFPLPSAEWQLVADYEHPLTFNGGEHSIPLFTKLYQLPGAGRQPKALLLVTATSGSHAGKVRWVSEKCPPARPRFFAEDFHTNKVTSHIECLVVNPVFSPPAYFKNNAKVLQALADKGVELPKSAVSLRSTVTSQAGTYLHVNLMAGKDFVGLPGTTLYTDDAHEVAPALVAWGEELHWAVRSAMRSLRGALQLPAIEFEKR
ncbi:hypothetical protein [Ideonella sp. BN130291]|uniref:hypothetical protein n=1 Tax=Ideonella sp. BN130291 TaxID=3112940 RepID=UPI002E262AF1|nr:hypothetical protein [Ideonella sp. BN130291]